MPIQSRVLPLDSYSGLDVVPFIAMDQVVAFQYILKNSPLTMTLRDHHLHCASATKDLFSVDFELANTLWCIPKDLSCDFLGTARLPLQAPHNHEEERGGTHGDEDKQVGGGTVVNIPIYSPFPLYYL